MPAAISAQLSRARLAVGVLFLVNAAAYANVAPRLPAIKAELGLSNTGLGTAVAAMPVGALLSGPLAGWAIGRWRSGRVAAACGVGFGVLLPAFAWAPSWVGLAGAFFALGLLDSLMDVSMNAHALRVQRGYGRSIVNAMHGVWSVGAVVGGLAGSVAAGAELALRTHLLAAGVGIVGLTLWARLHILPGPDDVERTDPEPAPGPAARLVGARGRAHRLLWLGVLVVMAAVVEDSASSWGAVLLRDELGTAAGVGGLAFLAFQGAMAVGRLTADGVVDRLGPVAVMRAGGWLVAVGLGAGLLVGRPASVVLGFAVAGLGVAPLFPLVYHAAGNLPGMSTGHGVAVVAWMSRVGFLVVPPLVGVIADAHSVRFGLAIVPLAGALIALQARTLADPKST